MTKIAHETSPNILWHVDILGYVLHLILKFVCTSHTWKVTSRLKLIQCEILRVYWQTTLQACLNAWLDYNLKFLHFCLTFPENNKLHTVSLYCQLSNTTEYRQNINMEKVTIPPLKSIGSIDSQLFPKLIFLEIFGCGTTLMICNVKYWGYPKSRISQTYTV